MRPAMYLRTRKSSVFLNSDAPDGEGGRGISREPTAVRTQSSERLQRKGISKQAFAIAPKIGEVDRLLRSRDSNGTPVVREVHPEVCFWALNGQKAMKFNKKKDAGEMERLRVLERSEPRTRAMYSEACRRFAGGGVGKDDVLDALVAAVTARCGHGRLKTIPGCPPTDDKGLPMEMVYWGA